MSNYYNSFMVNNNNMNPYIVTDGDSVETAGLEKSGIAGTEKEGDSEDKKEEDKVNITVEQNQDQDKNKVSLCIAFSEN